MERGKNMSKGKKRIEKKGLNISAKFFITAILVIFLLMVLTYGFTFLVPGGGISFWKWLLSPVLVLVRAHGLKMY